jgi:hypothetical protein
MESLSPFLWRTCTSYNMPVYPGARRIVGHPSLTQIWVMGLGGHPDTINQENCHAVCLCCSEFQLSGSSNGDNADVVFLAEPLGRVG